MLLIQSNIRDRLAQKYFKVSGVPLVLKKEEKEYLAARKKLKAAIFHRGTNTVAALLDRRIGQSDNIERRHAAGQVRLYLYRVGVQSEQP